MNGPRRLRESGGVTERLLDSASIDKPSRASRARAVELAATAGAFVTTTAGASAAAAKVGAITGSALYKSVAMWICVGALGGGSIALIGSELLAPSVSPSTQSGARPPATPLVVPEPAIPAPVAPSPEPQHDIKPEPAPAKAPAPAVPSHRAAPSALPAPPTSSSPVTPETQAIEAARDAVARGDSSGALRTLDNYDATHPNGSLKAESAALRVQAVSNTGNNAKARNLANDFEKKYPTSPLRGVVRDAARLK